MTIFVIWNKAIDLEFRAFYPSVAINGEQIEDAPTENATHFIVGTSRLNEAGQSALSVEFGANVSFTAEMPSEFSVLNFGT